MYVNCLIVAQKELNNLLKFHSLFGFFSFPFSLPHSLSLPLSKPLSHLSFSRSCLRLALPLVWMLRRRRHKSHFICINEFCKFWVALDVVLSHTPPPLFQAVQLAIRCRNRIRICGNARLICFISISSSCCLSAAKPQFNALPKQNAPSTASFPSILCFGLNSDLTQLNWSRLISHLRLFTWVSSVSHHAYAKLAFYLINMCVASARASAYSLLPFKCALLFNIPSSLSLFHHICLSLTWLLFAFTSIETVHLINTQVAFN